MENENENEVVRHGLGLCGAQRVGKSTLAKLYAERFGVPYVVVSASDTLARLGCDPKTDYPLEKRLELQNAILDDFSAQWAEVKRSFITDRTPIDLAAYMLADVTRASALDPELDEQVCLYVRKCFQAHIAFFDLTMLIQPGIPLVEAEKSAPASPAFMHHFNALATGLMYGLQDCMILGRDIVNLEDRVATLRSSWMRLNFGR